MRAASDGLQLLIAIKDLMFNVQEQKYVPLSIHLAKRQFFLLSQGQNTIGEYYEQFKNQTDVLNHIGAGIGDDDAIMKQVLRSRGINIEDATDDQEEAAELTGTQWYLALAFLMGSDRNRYGRLLEKLENDFTAGNDNYPKTLTDAYNMLLEWKDDPRLLIQMAGNDSISFATNMTEPNQEHGACMDSTQNEETPTTYANTTMGQKGRGCGGGRCGGRGGRGNANDNIQCFRCRAMGHYASHCPETLEDAQRMLAENNAAGTNLLQHATAYQSNTETSNELNFASLGIHDAAEGNDTSFVFTQDIRLIETQHGGKLPPEWILLDNQSTVDVFTNRRLLKNIRRSNKNMFIHCTAGVAKTNLIGDLPGYGTVWYHPDGIANILSLSKVKEKYRVTFDSDINNQFVVHHRDGTQQIFQQSPRWLYFLDTSLTSQPTSTTGTVLVNTVADNANSFSNADYAQAVLARKIQKIIGRPTTRSFIHFLDNNLLPNCPVNRKDVLRAEQIFGPNIGSLKGKTVRRQPPRVAVEEVSLPATIHEHYQEVTLACDIMYVNKIPFLMSISRHIRFGTAQHIKNQQGTTIFNGIRAIHQVYLQRGFRIRNAFMDGQFEPLRGNLAELGILLNTASNDEHVPEIERQIRTVKERTRAIYCTLPFQKMPRRLIIEMVYAANYWLNMFPRPGGISKTLSPRTLLTGQTWSYTTHCKLEFG